MIPAAEVTPELIVSLIALLAAGSGALVAVFKIGPERETTLVGAQDTVIDNLREEIDRHKRERDEAGARHRARMDRAEAKIEHLRKLQEEEAVHCDERIKEQQEQINKLRARLKTVELRSEGDTV